MSIYYFESEHNMPAKMVVLPLRCTVVKTPKALVVISPIDFKAEQIQKIKELGEVTDLVAPSLIHHLFLDKAIEHFPEAKVWGPPGCEEKIPEIKWDRIFSEDWWPYSRELDAQLIEGVSKLNEVAFFDKASRTLIVADFVFNLTEPKGWAASVMLRLLGTYGELAVSRLEKRFMEDPAAFDSSVKRILDWNFDRIAMGHGDVVPSGGKQKLVKALDERGFHFAQS